ATRGYLVRIVRGGLRPDAIRAHRARPTVDHVRVEGILYMGRRIRRREEPLHVGLVVGEEPRRIAAGEQAVASERGVLGGQAAIRPAHDARSRPIALSGAPPRPGVAEPEGRQDVERRGVGAAVRDREANEDILGRRLGVLDRYVEVAAVVEDAG